MNLGVLGLIGGAGKFAADYGAQRLKDINAEEVEERSLIRNMKYKQMGMDLEDARRKKIAEEVGVEAQGIANDRAKRMGGLIDQGADRDALKEGGLTDYEINQRMAKPTAEDRFYAGAKLGTYSDKDVATYEQGKEDRAAAREDKMELGQAQIASHEKIAREQLEARKEMQRLIIAGRKEAAAAGRQPFDFDPDKERKNAYALAGVTPSDVKIMDDPEKFDALPADRKQDIQLRVKRAEDLLLTSARANAPVDTVFRAMERKRAEAGDKAAQASSAARRESEARSASAPKSEPLSQSQPDVNTPVIDGKKVVDMQPAGAGLIGGKKYVVIYADGTRELKSGEDAERAYILFK